MPNQMFVCGSCRFGACGSSVLSSGADIQPCAALVLAFSCTNLHGPQGIVSKIDQMCLHKNVAMASAYCHICRRCTWLCDVESDLNMACLQFIQNWTTTTQICDAMHLMQDTWRMKKAMKFSTSYSDSTSPRGESTKSTSMKRKFAKE